VNRFIFALAFAGLLFGFTTTSARADLTISLSDVTLLSGQTTGTMDITVSYVNNPSSADNSNTLSGFGITLLITPVVGSGNDLQFSGAQSNPWDNATLAGNYVFAGQSAYQDNPSLFAFWSGPSTTTNMNDTISAGDYSDSSQGYVNVSASPTGAYSYLATVQFTAADVLNTEQFQVSLAPPSYDPNNLLTYFADQDGNNLPYASTGGLVTVDGQPNVSGTPEPSSFVTAFAGAVALLAYGWLSRSRVQRRPAVSTA
jgi:hypothetical protein